RKYARTSETVTAGRKEQTWPGDMIKAINDEIKSATEAKDDAALKAAQEKLKAATEVKTQCDKRLDDAKKANQTKDVPIALISTPIRLRINASPLKLASEAMTQALK